MIRVLKNLRKPVLVFSLIVLVLVVYSTQSNASFPFPSCSNKILVFSKIDTSKIIIGLDSLSQDSVLKNYSGKDVLIGVIDYGFDFNSPVWYDTSGIANYRIISYWNQNKVLNSSPPFGFYYSNPTLIQALQTDKINYSHGQQVANIIAGAGASLGNHFTGIAPVAKIALVSVEGSGPKEIEYAIEHVFNLADSLGLPCVINLSLANPIGPHDGTTSLDTYIDSVSGPGRIIVCSASNLGDQKVHLEKSFSPTDSIIRTGLSLDRPINSRVTADFWGLDTIDRYEIRVGIWDSLNESFDTTSLWMHPFNIPLGSFSFTSQSFSYDFGGVSDTFNVLYYLEKDPLNYKPQTWISFDQLGHKLPAGKNIVFEIKSHSAQIHAWTNHIGNAQFTNYGLNTFHDGNSSYTISDLGANSNAAITVGSSNSTLHWTIGNGQLVQRPGLIGDLEARSSKGPSVDGRLKPEIVAPGNSIRSSLNSYDNSAKNRATDSIQIAGRTYYFGFEGGTSFSTAIVSGTIALMLEACPELDPFQVKRIFESSARADAFTSTVPNFDWGYGKLNAKSAIYESLQSDTIRIKSCEAYYWDKAALNFNQSGFYHHFAKDSAGCDSICYLDLKINSISAVIDTSDAVLWLAPDSMDSYLWIDCASMKPIDSTLFNTRQFFMAAKLQVAVVIQRGECIDTSKCYDYFYFSDQETMNMTYKLYPNLSSGMLTLESEREPFKSVQLISLSGQLVSSFSFSPTSKHKLDLSCQPSGEYFVIVESVDSEKIALPILLED